jgi:hypothetical protein
VARLALESYVDTATGLLVPKSLVDAKGDIFAGTANDTVARKAVGADRSRLEADSSQTDGLVWRAPNALGPAGFPTRCRATRSAKRTGR